MRRFPVRSVFFQTTGLLFDLRVGADVGFPTYSYELDIYAGALGVEFFTSSGFLFRVAAVGPVGADVGPGIPGAALAGQFLYTDATASVFSGSADAAPLTSTSVPFATEIAEPVPLLILGLGLAGFRPVRRRSTA